MTTASEEAIIKAFGNMTKPGALAKAVEDAPAAAAKAAKEATSLDNAKKAENNATSLMQTRTIQSTGYSIIDPAISAKVTAPILYDPTNVTDPCTDKNVNNNKGCSIQTYSSARGHRMDGGGSWDKLLWPGQYALNNSNGYPAYTGSTGAVPWRTNNPGGGRGKFGQYNLTSGGSCHQSFKSSDSTYSPRCIWDGKTDSAGNPKTHDATFPGYTHQVSMLNPRTDLNLCCSNYVPIKNFTNDDYSAKFISNAYYGWCYEGAYNTKSYCYAKQLWIRANVLPYTTTAIDPSGTSNSGKVVAGLSDTNNIPLIDNVYNTKDRTYYSGGWNVSTNGVRDNGWCQSSTGNDWHICKLSNYMNTTTGEFTGPDKFNPPQDPNVLSTGYFPATGNTGGYGNVNTWGTLSLARSNKTQFGYGGCPWWNCPDPGQETWGTKWKPGATRKITPFAPSTPNTNWENTDWNKYSTNKDFNNVYQNFVPILPGESYTNKMWSTHITNNHMEMPAVQNLAVMYKPFKTATGQQAAKTSFPNSNKLSVSNYILTPQLLGDRGSFNILRQDEHSKYIDYINMCDHINAWRVGTASGVVNGTNDFKYMSTASFLHMLSTSLINDWFTYSSKRWKCQKPASGLTLLNSPSEHYNNILDFITMSENIGTAASKGLKTLLPTFKEMSAAVLEKLVPFPKIEQDSEHTDSFILNLTTTPQNFFYNPIFTTLPLAAGNWATQNKDVLETYCNYLCWRLFNDAYGSEGNAWQTSPPFKNAPPVDQNYYNGGAGGTRDIHGNPITSPTTVSIPDPKTTDLRTFQDLSNIINVICYDITKTSDQTPTVLTLNEFYTNFHKNIYDPAGFEGSWGTGGAYEPAPALPKYFAVSVTIKCKIEKWSPWSKLIYLRQLTYNLDNFSVTTGKGICSYANGGQVLPIQCANSIMTGGTDQESLNLLTLCKNSTQGTAKISKFSCYNNQNVFGDYILSAGNISGLCACINNGLQPKDGTPGSLKASICLAKSCSSDQRTQLLQKGNVTADDFCKKNKCEGLSSICNGYRSYSLDRPLNFDSIRYKTLCNKSCAGVLRTNKLNEEFTIVFSIVTLLVFFTSMVTFNYKKFNIVLTILLTIIITSVFGGVTFFGGKILNGCSSCTAYPGKPVCYADFSWLFGNTTTSCLFKNTPEYLQTIKIPDHYCQGFNNKYCECMGTTDGSDPAKGTNKQCNAHGSNCSCLDGQCVNKDPTIRRTEITVKRSKFNLTYLAGFIIAMICIMLLFNALKPVNMNQLLVKFIYLLIIAIPIVVYYFLFIRDKEVVVKTLPNCATSSAPAPVSPKPAPSGPDNSVCSTEGCNSTFITNS